MNYGKLIVLSNMKKINNKIHWECKCQCGDVKFVRADHLKDGHVKSCGKCGYKTTHGKSNDRIYKIHRGMIGRCADNSKKESYKHINVCPEWTGENGFINFYNWATVNEYSDDLTLDRIDNNGDYKPSNCRWITHKEQQNNKSNNRRLEFNGDIKTASEWAEIFNVDRNIIYYLYKKYDEMALYHLKEDYKVTNLKKRYL